MADAWDYGPGNRDDGFSLNDYVSSFTSTVTSLIGSVATIKKAADNSGLVGGNQTRQDDAAPRKDNTILYLMIGVGIVWLVKRG